MTKAVIALFKEVEDARSTKILLESLRIRNEDCHVIIKDSYKEELDILTGYGFSKDDIYNIDKGFKDGNIVLSIMPINNYQEVIQLLIENGSKTIFTSDNTIEENDYLLKNKGPTVLDGELIDESLIKKSNFLDINDNLIQLHEERLDVDKRKIQTGEVIIRKEIIEEMKTITVPVLREELIIEKLDKDNNLQEVERITLMQEEASINKVAVVKEDISIKKVEVEETKVVSEKLKKEEIEVLNKKG